MGVLDDAIREHLELKRRHGASDEEINRAEQDALGPARRDLIEPAESDALVPDETGHVPHGDPIAHQEAPAPVGDAPPAEAGASVEEAAHVEIEPEGVADAPTEYLPPEGEEADAAAALAEAAFRPVEGAALAEEPIVEGEAEPEAAAIDAGPQPAIDPEAAPYEEPTAPQEPVPAPEPHIEEHAVEDPQAEHPEEPHRQGDPLVEEEHHVEEHTLEEAEHHFEEETAEHQHEEPPAPVEEERNERDDLLEDTPDFLQETPEHDRLWFEQRPPREFDFDE